MTLEEWNAYFERVFLSKRHSQQVAAPGRWDALPAGDQQRYDSADAIRSSHSFYVIE